MSVPCESLTGFAGPAGIGAICILAAFLFLDGQNPNLFPSVEFYAKTSTWSIVAAIPLLATSYVLGVITISVSQLVAQGVGIVIGVPSPPHSIEIVALGNDKDTVRAQIFLKAYQDQEILCGCGIAFVLLGLAALSEKRNLRNLSSVINVAAALVIVGGLIGFGLSFVKAKLAHEVASSIAASSGDNVTSKPK